VPAAAGQAGELIHKVRSLLRIGPTLLLALQLPAAQATDQPSQPAADLRGTALTALNRCSTTRQQQMCLEASTALQALIRQEEGTEQRQLRPRCLGALTQVETVLAAFRWRLERSENLQRVVDAASVQCSDSSGAGGQ
jgi:hypothetical protein